MKLKLLSIFLISQVIEFSLFYGISYLIANYLSVETLKVFFPILGLDIILTVLFRGEQVRSFIEYFFSNDETQY
jgi:hypothetical protein